MRIITTFGYARVSTADQDLDSQIEQIKDKGATVIYYEHFTGATRNRPEFQKLMDDIQPGDTLVVTKMDRIARSAIDGLMIINELRDKNVDVYIMNMGVFDDSPIGAVVRTMLLAFAEFERTQIVERTQRGKAYAKANNPDFKDGRPQKYKYAQRKHALELLQSGSTYSQVESMTGMSKSTLIRMKRKFDATGDV